MVGEIHLTFLNSSQLLCHRENINNGDAQNEIHGEISRRWYIKKSCMIVFVKWESLFMWQYALTLAFKMWDQFRVSAEFFFCDFKDFGQINFYFSRIFQKTLLIFLQGWLAHLARHVPRNSRVKYAVGSNLTGNINA